MIRPINENDAAAICRIYNHYVAHTIITFEESPVTEEEMKERIRDITAKYPWLLYEHEGKVIGYAYAGPWKSRCAYRYSVESSVYLDHAATGRGVGSQLYTALFERLEQTDIHSMIGGIALPNEGSIALHEKFGFKKVAHFKEVGFKFNQWIDVGYWERILKKDP